MNKSNSNSKSDTIDYYSIVSKIRPRRSPSIFHREYKYYWVEFPQTPVYSIYNTTFYKVTPMANMVDCTKYGQVHYWVRVGSIYSPALVVFHFSETQVIMKIRYYFFGGMWVEVLKRKSMIEIENPDEELFDYVLAGFIIDYMRPRYSFSC